MLLCIASIPLDGIFPLINSDALFFQVLFQDLIVEGNSLRGWDLNTTFTLIPNALLYLIALLVSQNPFVSITLHGLLQYGLFFLALAIFYWSIRSGPPVHWHIPGALLINFLAIDGIITGDYYILSIIIHPYHFGSFTLFLALGAANISYLRNPRVSAMLFIVLVGSLGVFSNKMLLIMLSIPWASALAIAWIKRWAAPKILIRSIALNAAAAALGYLLLVWVRASGFVTLHDPRPFSLDMVAPSMQTLMWAFARVFTQVSPLGFVAWLAALLTVANIVLCIRYVWAKAGQPLENTELAIRVWLLGSLAFTGIVFLVPGLLGIYFCYSAIRYNIFVLMLPLVNMGLIAHRITGGRWATGGGMRRVAYTFYGIFAVAIVLIALKTSPIEGYRQKRDHYPLRAQALDSLATLTELKQGVSLFWEAKATTVYSRRGIRVVQVYHDLLPYPLAVARSWYYPQQAGQPQPVFNFIFEDSGIDSARLTALFGHRIDTFTIHGYRILRVPDFIYSAPTEIRVLEDDAGLPDSEP